MSTAEYVKCQLSAVLLQQNSSIRFSPKSMAFLGSWPPEHIKHGFCLMEWAINPIRE